MTRAANWVYTSSGLKQGIERCFTFETIEVLNLCLFEECDSKAKQSTDH